MGNHFAIASSVMSPEHVAKLGERWTTWKNEEKSRHEFVEELMATIRDLGNDNDTLKAQNSNLEFHERHYVIERERLNKECRTLRGRLEAGPFVAVLIDGDNTMFIDDFVVAGADGGHRAAKKLQEAIQSYCTKLLDCQPHWEVIVRIYVNLRGLKSAYARSRVVSDAACFEDFLVGFNRELSLFEFVDVGSDKEAADNKIRANLSLYWKDEHCRHVLLAGSADTSYVNFLRQYCGESRLATKLTLVESVSFPLKFRELAARFHNTKFEDVFRDTKLEVKEQVPRDVSSRPTYANTAAGPASPGTQIPAALTLRPTQNALLGQILPGQIRLNAQDQRIDDPLPQWEKHVEMDLRRRNLCPQHFLTQCNKIHCSRVHNGSINEEEKAALIRIGRDDPCDSGTRCYDKRCVSAHRCLYGWRCNYGSDCKYGPEMHNVDKRVVKSR